MKNDTASSCLADGAEKEEMCSTLMNLHTEMPSRLMREGSLKTDMLLLV